MTADIIRYDIVGLNASQFTENRQLKGRVGCSTIMYLLGRTVGSGVGFSVGLEGGSKVGLRLGIEIGNTVGF